MTRSTRGRCPFRAGPATQPGDIVFCLGPGGEVTFWSAEAQACTGFAPDEVLGRRFESIASRPGPGADRRRFSVPQVMAGHDFAGGVECVRKDGSRLALYIYATAGRNERGRVAGVMVVGREVTGFWHAEGPGRTAQERFGMLFDLLEDAVVVADRRGRVVEANAAACRLAGRPYEQLVGLRLVELVPPESRRSAESGMFELVRSGRLQSLLTILRPDGSPRDVAYSAARVRYDGARAYLAVGRDATEKLRAAREREESAEKYRRMFESAPDAVFLETLDGRILEANDSACRMLGYSREELLKLRVEHLLPADARAWLPRITESLLKHGAFSAEGVNQRKDGSVVPVEITCSLVNLPSGPAVLAMVRDISERRAAEASLRASEERLRAIQENVPVGLFRTTPDGRFVSVNPAAVRMFGFASAEDMLAASVGSVYADPAERKGLVERLARDGRLDNAELLVLRKDGTTFPALLNVRAGAGVYDGAVQDISERTAAVRALAESEENYRSVVERASDGICVIQEGRLKFVNRRLAEIAGYTAEELTGQLFLDYIHPDDRQMVVERYRRRLAGEPVPSSYTARFIRRDGTTMAGEINAAVTTYDGSPADVVLVRDISERQRAEAALRASEEQYRTALDAMLDAAHVVDRDLRIVVANKACRELYARLGLAVPEPGRTLKEITPFLGEKVWAEYRQVFETGQPLLTEESNEVGGTVVYTETRKTPVFESGRVVRLLTVIHDVTERRLAEQVIREQRRQLATLVANLPGMAYRCRNDACWTMEYASGGALELTGLPVEELVGTDRYSSLIHPADRDWTDREIRAALDAREPFRMTYRLGDRWVWEQGRGVYDDAGNAVAFEGFIADVTALRQAEDELRASREQYRTIFEDSPMGIYRTTPDGRILLVNPALARMLGYDSPADVLCRRLSQADFEPGYARADFVRLMAEHGEVKGLEAAWRRRDGTTLHIRENARAVRGPDGAVRYYDGTVEDVTERRQAELRLEQSEEKYRVLAETAPVAVGMTDIQGRWTYVSPRMAQLHGYESAEQLVGTPAPGLIVPEERERVQQAALAAMTTTGLLSGLATRALRRDGTTFDAEFSTAVVRGPGGTPTGAITIVQDTTRRNQVQRALAESEANFRAQADNAFDGIAVYGQDGRFVYANRRIAEICGQPFDKMVGMRFTDLVGPDDRGRLIERARRRLAGEPEPNQYELTVVRADGTPVPVELSVARTTWQGEPAGIAIARDLSARRRLESEHGHALGEARESEERFHRLVELSPDGVAVHQDGKVVMVNRAGARILGYSDPAEMVGLGVMELVHPDDRERAAQRIRQALAEGRTGELVEERFRQKDDTWLWVEVTNAPIMWHGRLAVQVVVRDISERKWLQGKLEELTAQLQAIFRHVPYGLAAEHAGRVAWANQRFAELFGYGGPGDMYGLPIERIVAPEDRERVAGYTALRDKGLDAPATYTFKALRRDGTVVELENSVTTYDIGGRSYILGSVRPVEGDKPGSR